MTSEQLKESLERNILKYLTGRKSLSAFHRWFVAATWDIHLSTSTQVEKTVRQIQSIFDEYSYGGRSEETLRANLRPFVTSLKSE